MRLATFIHISDLHFGSINEETLDAEASRIWAMFPYLDGFLGHRYRALVMLDTEFGRLAYYENAQLIVTGDITTKGHHEEFAIARNYLGGEFIFPDGNSLGLGVSNWKDWMIPGNHDHWPGSIHIIGKPTQAFSHAFVTMPEVTQFHIPSSPYFITFMWIDSDADVGPRGLNRIKARGSFSSQIESLKANIGDIDTNEIRVLCLHHSPEKTGDSLSIDDKSRKKLEDLIVDKQVSVLLTGHVHDPPIVQSFTAKNASGSRTYLEARCGTTSQNDFAESPYSYERYLACFGVEPERMNNFILVYRITQKKEGLFWESELLELGVESFAPSSSQNYKIMKEFRLR